MSPPQAARRASGLDHGIEAAVERAPGGEPGLEAEAHDRAAARLALEQRASWPPWPRPASTGTCRRRGRGRWRRRWSCRSAPPAPFASRRSGRPAWPSRQRRRSGSLLRPGRGLEEVAAGDRERRPPPRPGAGRRCCRGSRGPGRRWRGRARSCSAAAWALTRATTVASRFSAAARRMKALRVGGGDHHGHALLRLGEGELGAVQAVVFLGHAVEVDLEARRPARRWPRRRRRRRSRCSA